MYETLQAIEPIAAVFPTPRLTKLIPRDRRRLSRAQQAARAFLEPFTLEIEAVADHYPDRLHDAEKEALERDEQALAAVRAISSSRPSTRSWNVCVTTWRRRKRICRPRRRSPRPACTRQAPPSKPARTRVPRKRNMPGPRSTSRCSPTAPNDPASHRRRPGRCPAGPLERARSQTHRAAGCRQCGLQPGAGRRRALLPGDRARLYLAALRGQALSPATAQSRAPAGTLTLREKFGELP